MAYDRIPREIHLHVIKESGAPKWCIENIKDILEIMTKCCYKGPIVLLILMLSLNKMSYELASNVWEIHSVCNVKMIY